MGVRGIARAIEHTLLHANATRSDIERLCAEAVEYEFYSVCVSPCNIPIAKEFLTGNIRLTSVCGFPLGDSGSEVKSFEALRAVEAGADEVDMVMRVGAAVEGRWDIVEADIRAVREAVPEVILKVIIETCYLDEAQKRRSVDVIAAAGADYVKTSTGFGPSGARVEDVLLLSNASAGRLRVKAAGGIRDTKTANAMMEAGANLIGTSSGVKIVNAQH